MTRRILMALIQAVILVTSVWASPQEDAGMDKQGDHPNSLQELRPLAEHGDAAAQFNLGRMYALGKGLPQDLRQARHWYELAANQGYAQAQVSLGALHELGMGVPRDFTQARNWYEKAAAQGDASGEVSLGAIYEHGLGVPTDFAQARHWYEKAAAQGDALAQLSLGALYEEGQGVSQDYVQAYMWYELAASQDKTSTWTLDNLAKRMTQAQIANAQRLAREWKSRNLKRTHK